MKKYTYLTSLIILLIVLAVVGGFLSMIYGDHPAFREKTKMVETRIRPQVLAEEIVFNPPGPEEAPLELRDAITLGYNIMMETHKYAPANVGNKLNCRNCHFDGGRVKQTISLVGVAAKYPTYRGATSTATDLVDKISGCFERSLNGQAPAPQSREMMALTAYCSWISKGVPIYADVPWLGLKPIRSEHQPAKEIGMKTFTDKCSMCHGAQGEGTGIAPPLWGNESFNDGSIFVENPYLASFIYYFMPRGNPDLSVEQAVDIAGFVISQPRPHYKGLAPKEAAKL